MSRWPWSELGLDGPAPLEEVRRAYAQLVKEAHPEEDPEGFQRLHRAYQAARQEARRAAKGNPPVVPGIEEQGAHCPRNAQPPLEREEKLDVQALLHQENSQEKEPQEDGKQEKRETWDFKNLLNQEKSQKKEPPGNTEHEERETWDFQNLLNQEKSQEKEPQGNTEQEEREMWEFERFFQEEERQRAERQQKKYGGGEQGRVIDQALQLVYRLLQEERPRSTWEQFLQSKLFSQVKDNAQFMAGLAEAFRTRTVSNPKIREDVLQAYGLSTQTVSRKHWKFVRDVGGLKERTWGEQKWRGWMSFLRSFCLVEGIVALALVLFILLLNGILYISEHPERVQAQEICQWLEEDFGIPVESAYLEKRSDSVRDYYLPEQQCYIEAWPAGERDLTQGKLGYESNLANVFLTQELEKFAQEWEAVCTLKELDEEGNLSSAYEVPAGYLLSTGLWDGADCIAALGERLDQLAQESWYTLLDPAFQLRLAVWDQPYFTYTAPGDPFDGAGVRSYYEDDLPAELVAYLVMESGLAELDFGTAAYGLTDLGSITLQGDTYILVGGVDAAANELVRLYLYDSNYLISTPYDTFDPEMDRVAYSRLRNGGEKVENPGGRLPWPTAGIRRFAG